jgi:hypothetical protein
VKILEINGLGREPFAGMTLADLDAGSSSYIPRTAGRRPISPIGESDRSPRVGITADPSFALDAIAHQQFTLTRRDLAMFADRRVSPGSTAFLAERRTRQAMELSAMVETRPGKVQRRIAQASSVVTRSQSVICEE